MGYIYNINDFYSLGFAIFYHGRINKESVGEIALEAYTS